MKTVSWQKLLMLAALALLAIGLTACAKPAAAAPTLQETPAPAQEEEAAPAEQTEAQAEEQAESGEGKEAVSTVEYETFIAVMPAASGGGMRVIALRFFEDATLTWHTQFLNGEPPIEEVGVWEDNGDGTLTVAVTGRADRQYDEPDVLVFQRDGEELIAVEYDLNMYGSEGLRFRSVMDLAADIETALFTIDLTAGFPLDPTFMSVNAGGVVPARLFGAGCRGFVNVEPVVSVNWTGDSDFLEAFFVSDDDPTLMVMTPDGQILCNDDANDYLLDPVVEISNPVDGQYRIWLGSFEEGHLLPGILVLTTKPEVNLGTFNLDSFIQRAQLPEEVPQHDAIADQEALLETLEMAVAESPELTDVDLPTTVDVVADGIVPLFQLPLEDRGCAGLVTGAPSYTFNWVGESDSLRIMFEGDGDSSLLVLGPELQYGCNDDSAEGNQNPVLDISNPVQGLHAVYVGRISPEAPVTGVLSITDQTDEPDVLAPEND